LVRNCFEIASFLLRKNQIASKLAWRIGRCGQNIEKKPERSSELLAWTKKMRLAGEKQGKFDWTQG